VLLEQQVPKVKLELLAHLGHRDYRVQQAIQVFQERLVALVTPACRDRQDHRGLLVQQAELGRQGQPVQVDRQEVRVPQDNKGQRDKQDCRGQLVQPDSLDRPVPQELRVYLVQRERLVLEELRVIQALPVHRVHQEPQVLPVLLDCPALLVHLETLVHLERMVELEQLDQQDFPEIPGSLVELEQRGKLDKREQLELRVELEFLDCLDQVEVREAPEQLD